MSDTIEQTESKLRALMSKFDKDLHIMSDKPINRIEAISTGSYFIDIATGIGGIPKGRITEVYAEESAGKTTLAIHTCIEAQKQYPNLFIGFIDVEHALDLKYAEKLGLDLTRAVIAQPDSGERAIEIAENLIRSGTVSLVVIDSVAGLTPEEDLINDVDKKTQASLARLMGKACKRLKNAIFATNTALLFINQIRIITMGNFTQKGPMGGRALKFFASMRISLKRDNTPIIEKVGDKAIPIADVVTAEIKKNKMAPPFREGKFYITYGKGISKIDDIFDIAVQCNIINKSGNWYNYADSMKENGRPKTVKFLLDPKNEETLKKITKEVDLYYESCFE